MARIKVEDSPLISPVNSYCFKMDRRLMGKTYYDYSDEVETNYHNYLRKDPYFYTKLLMEDFKYRHLNQLNILVEIYGQQGSGKSLFGQDLAGRIADIYGVKFNMGKHTLADFDILDKELHNSPFKTTFIVDEQPKAFYGHGSTRIMRGLQDYEEICRYTMKNIIYIAPTSRDHTSYYVFKEGNHDAVIRQQNTKCETCKLKNKCLPLLKKSLCDMPFYEKHGYPKAFEFLLYTERKADERLLPRFYVRLPVLPPNLMMRYDGIKQKNIEIFESKLSLGSREKTDRLKKFVEKYKDKLLTEDGKPVKVKRIKVLVLNYFGNRSTTTSELDLWTEEIRMLLEEMD